MQTLFHRSFSAGTFFAMKSDEDQLQACLERGTVGEKYVSSEIESFELSEADA